MKKATLRTAGTAALGVAFAAAVSGPAAAVAPGALGGSSLPSADAALSQVTDAVPAVQRVVQAVGSLNPSEATRALAPQTAADQSLLSGVTDALDRVATPGMSQGAPQAAPQEAPQTTPQAAAHPAAHPAPATRLGASPAPAGGSFSTVNSLFNQLTGGLPQVPGVSGVGGL